MVLVYSTQFGHVYAQPGNKSSVDTVENTTNVMNSSLRSRYPQTRTHTAYTCAVTIICRSCQIHYWNSRREWLSSRLPFRNLARPPQIISTSTCVRAVRARRFPGRRERFVTSCLGFDCIHNFRFALFHWHMEFPRIYRAHSANVLGGEICSILKETRHILSNENGFHRSRKWFCAISGRFHIILLDLNGLNECVRLCMSIRVNG